MIVELATSCGLNLKLDTLKPEIIFKEALNFSTLAARTLYQMREVLLDKDIKQPQELYFMYRDIYRLSDKPLLEKNKLRYDATVIKPDYLGRELMKTAGHYHPGSFGELYEVVYGRCFCLLQRSNPSNHKIIEEVILVEARKGQKIVIPPGFGHTLINPGPEILVTSNWVSSQFASEYDLYQKAQGAAYFMIKEKEKFTFMPNKYFQKLDAIKFVKPAPHLDKFGLREDEPIYPLIVQDARKLDFLNNPQDYDYSDVYIKTSLTQ